MIEKINYPSVWDDFVCVWCIKDSNMKFLSYYVYLYISTQDHKMLKLIYLKILFLP